MRDFVLLYRGLKREHVRLTMFEASINSNLSPYVTKLVAKGAILYILSSERVRANLSARRN